MSCPTHSPASGGTAEAPCPDDSSRLPALNLIFAAVKWLVIGSLIHWLAAVKAQSPGWMAHCPAFTFGRLSAAASNALVFGFASQAGLGVGLWILARLNLRPVAGSLMVTLGTVFWNLALVLGIAGILLGDSTGQPGLELPKYASVLLLGAYLVIGGWGVLTHACGRQGRLFVSHWYLFAALFWFPWLYATAQVLAVLWPARGVLQPIVAAWFAGGLQNLWLTPLALAAAYYLIPAATGRPVHRPELAAPAFWLLALMGGCAGTARLVGGPVPAWIVSVGIAAQVMLVLPMILIAINLLPAYLGNFRVVWRDRSLRFVMVGLLFGGLVTIGNAVNALRSMAVLHHFTLNEAGRSQVFFQGFVGMVLMGAAYFAVPRLMGRAWPSRALVTAHFWATVAGVVSASLPMLWVGHKQGAALNDSKIGFPQVLHLVESALCWRSAGLILLLLGGLAMIANVAWMVFQCCQECGEEARGWLVEPKEARS